MVKCVGVRVCVSVCMYGSSSGIYDRERWEDASHIIYMTLLYIAAAAISNRGLRKFIHTKFIYNKRGQKNIK